MVNTFITGTNFDDSARSLDNRRLGKQRVEAMQILHLIEQLAFLARHFYSPIPVQHRREWIRDIVRKYQTLPHRYVIREMPNTHIRLYIRVDVRIFQAIPKKVAFKKPIIIEGIQFYPSDTVMSLGFVYHPAVQMWLGYENSLRAYINAHIREWIRRGNANTMRIYEIPQIYLRPEWTCDENFHRIHRASLLKKERDRNEPPWYIHQIDFVNAGEFTGYNWPT